MGFKGGNSRQKHENPYAVMEKDAKRMRGARPFIFTNLRDNQGVADIARFIELKGGLSVN